MTIKQITGIAYFVCLFLGIHAAYTGNMPVAMFFAITCAAESIAKSIDYWPNTKKGKK